LFSSSQGEVKQLLLHLSLAAEAVGIAKEIASGDFSHLATKCVTIDGRAAEMDVGGTAVAFIAVPFQSVTTSARPGETTTNRIARAVSFR
jgi:hypothetical protein